MNSRGRRPWLYGLTWSVTLLAMTLSQQSCSAPLAPSAAVDCAGFKSIPVSPLELAALYPGPKQSRVWNDAIPAELLAQFKQTFQLIAAHNRYLREHCAPSASAHGWVSRPDIGKDVGELPNGKLYNARLNEGEPIIASCARPSARAGFVAGARCARPLPGVAPKPSAFLKLGPIRSMWASHQGSNQ